MKFAPLLILSRNGRTFHFLFGRLAMFALGLFEEHTIGRLAHGKPAMGNKGDRGSRRHDGRHGGTHGRRQGDGRGHGSLVRVFTIFTLIHISCGKSSRIHRNGSRSKRISQRFSGIFRSRLQERGILFFQRKGRVCEARELGKERGILFSRIAPQHGDS